MSLRYDLEEFCLQATRIFLGHIVTIDSASDTLSQMAVYDEILVGEMLRCFTIFK